MACQIRNATFELPSSGVIMGKWSSGQPFSYDHDAEAHGVGLDLGSSAPGDGETNPKVAHHIHS